MEKSTLIQQLYNGEVFPAEQLPRVTTNEYTELCRKIEALENKLIEILPESEKELFNEYKSSILGAHDIEQQNCFVYAFRMGGRFIIEML